MSPRKTLLPWLVFVAVFLFGAIASAQTPPGAPQQGSPPPAKGRPFVDRDGDGIHDGMEHRFRKHKRDQKKKGLKERGMRRQQRQQGQQGNR